jgi:site-specific DNA-methyltransferase (adenine-specific)
MYGSGFPKGGLDEQGRGTSLKPAFEPVVVARKPVVGTVASNLLKYRTGALNIDASRIKHRDEADLAVSLAKNPGRDDAVTSGVYGADRPQQVVNTSGRFPANVILDESQAAELDATTAHLKGGVSVGRNANPDADKPASVYGTFKKNTADVTYGDSGGASRFFYTAKADGAERPVVGGIAHPTVKPLDLMRYLVRLVTPKGGVVLEPFAGSGTTLEAAVLEGFRVIGIEREADYIPLITHRLDKPHTVGLDLFGDAA